MDLQKYLREFYNENIIFTDVLQATNNIGIAGLMKQRSMNQ